ncbi:aminotransferase [Microlunatus endophyticus]|uniref:Aminotransferase n=1 Tax=Microlunatus endophyticus TaxID=1716077 RepID=A0A917WA55_9ACTN|nr:pyridoxal phosphate-dependent aminotransferase [Microlunatus endophyticus]GGL83114.1 aminotransferase [Microlunatus endophyticus]
MTELTDRQPLVTRMRAFGTTIFAQMSALALETGSVNLGQGFPDTDGPAEILEAATRAINSGHNQYPPGPGVLPLREAISEHQLTYYGLDYDPNGEILVTAGATEAITAAILALCEPGDEVIAFEPTYDSYAASIAMAHAVLKPVRLDGPDFALDHDRLLAQVTDRTKLLLINTPHNPTGRVLTETELGWIRDLAVERDLIVITDEVYEHLVYEGVHRPLATFEGMRERTIQVSSAGKTFAVTGWKVGWVCSTPELVSAVTTTKQFLTFVNAGPLQYAVAEGLRLPPERLAEVGQRLKAARDQLAEGLTSAGIPPFRCQGTYFLTSDVSVLGYDDGVDFCFDLPKKVGVVAIPSRLFYLDPGPAKSYVRFAFCKKPAVLAEAAERLARLR